jgi:hypothetical protein
MICYILIIFSLLLLYYYTIERKEHFIEKCYKNISNRMKNGGTKYFDNTLIDTIYSDHESNIQHKTDIQVLDVLPLLKEYNVNKISSNNKWEEHNDLYTKYKYNMEGVFNDLHQKVDNKKKEIDNKKKDLDSKLMVIQDKSNSIIKKSNNEGIENRLKPSVLKNIDIELYKKTLNKVQDSSIANFINRTELNSVSNAYNWQYIEDNNTPVRINAKTGKVECYSVDNIKCETDYRNKNGNNMYHVDNAKEIDCNKDSAELCNLEKKFLDRYPDIYDYKSCPEGWSYIKKNICKAPLSFTKNINNKYINDPNCKTNICIDLNQPLEKLIEYASNDDIKFKNKINASAFIKQKNDIDRNITKKINSIMGNTDQVSKADLGNSNYFKKGILTRVYNVVNNVKSSSLRHQILSSNINFNWSASNVLGITSKFSEINKIYIEFMGYLYIPKDITQIKLRLGSDSYSILYLSTDSSKLDVSVTIDRSDAVSYDKTESGILSVKQDSYIPFKLVYHDNDLESKLNLEWAIGENAKEKTNSFEIIASSYFFVNVSECEDSIKMESLNDIVVSAPIIKWKVVYSKGTYGNVDLGEATTNELFKKSKIFKRDCLDCNFQFKTIFYKRITEIPSVLSIYKLFNDWKSYTNILNTDFKLYNSYDDLLSDTNSWDKCTYDEPSVGFPKTCYNSNAGVEIANQWNSLTKPGGQQNIKFSVLEL